MATNDVDMDIEEKVEIEEDATPTPKEEKPKRKRDKADRPKQKSGWLGKIVALFLGIIIGIAGGLGGVGGLAYYFATKKTIKQTADFVKSVSGFEVPLSTYLTEEYADKTLLNAVKSTLDVVKKIGNGTGTLNDAKSVSPKVQDLVSGKTGIISIFDDFGIHLNAEELMAKKILKPNTVKGEDNSYLTDYLRAELKNAPAGDLLKANNFKGNKLIDAVVYGEKGEDYDVDEKGEKVMKPGKTQLTVGGLLGDDLMTRLNATPIDNIMDIKQTDTMMCEIAYGPKHRYVYDEATDMVNMQQMFYTFDGTKFFDDENKEVATTKIEQKENGDYILTFEDQSTQLVKFENEKYMVYTNEETPQPIKYKKTVYGDLEGNMLSVIDRVSLPTVLGVTKGDGKSHAIMEAIAFDNDGNPRTLGMFKQDNQAIINGIKLSTVLPVDTSSNVIMYILYGRKDIHYTVKEGVVKPLQQRVAVLDGKVFNAYGELIAGAVANGTTDYTFEDVTYTLSPDASLPEIKVKWTETVDETTTKHEAMAQTYFVSLDGEALMYQESTIETLKDGTTISKINDRLTLGEVLPTAGSNKILNNLKDSKITDLSADINALTFDQVFGDEFYYRGKNTTDGTTSIDYHIKAIDGVETIVNKDGSVATGVVLCDKNGNEVSFEQKDLALAGSWKYILQTGKNTDGTPIIDRNIKLMDMGGIMDNMMKNVRTASVRELQEDGMIDNLGTLNDTKIMSTVKVPTTTAPYYTEKVITIKVGDVDVPADQLDGDASDTDYVGDLTIDQLLKYTSAVLSALTPTT